MCTQAFEALIDEGDSVLIETPVYASVTWLFPQRWADFDSSSSGVLGLLAAFPCTLIGTVRRLLQFSHQAHWPSLPFTEVTADGQGLNPASLESVLSNWGTTHPGKRFPKLLYTIPSGSNPTGASIPEHRKIEVCVPFRLLSANNATRDERRNATGSSSPRNIISSCSRTTHMHSCTTALRDSRLAAISRWRQRSTRRGGASYGAHISQ
jgi:hypothetical protein